MKLRRAAAAAACLTALATPAAASAADPPPGAAMSDNLEYVTRIAGRERHHRGQVRPVAGSRHPRRHGPLRLQDLRRDRPGEPGAPRRRSCRRASTRTPSRRLLAGRGHGARHEAQPDHRRARPAAQRADPVASGCPDNDGLAVRDPDCRSGFFVISYSDPANLTQVGDFVSLPVRPHRELHPGLQVHLDRRPGAALGPGLPRPDHHPGPREGAEHGQPPDRRRAADLGHRPAQPGESGGLRRPDRPVAQRRLHGLLARRRRGRARASPGSPAAAASAATRPPAVTATRTSTASARRRRSTRSSSPAAASPGTTRSATATTAPRSP